MNSLCFIFAICDLVHDINTNYIMAFILIASGRKMNPACEILIAVPWPLVIFQKRFLDVVSSKWNIVSISCTKSNKIATKKNSFNINYEKMANWIQVCSIPCYAIWRNQYSAGKMARQTFHVARKPTSPSPAETHR